MFLFKIFLKQVTGQVTVEEEVDDPHKGLEFEVLTQEEEFAIEDMVEGSTSDDSNMDVDST